MFNKHPKGLIAASFANLGERFGFYTMLPIHPMCAVALPTIEGSFSF